MNFDDYVQDWLEQFIIWNKYVNRLWNIYDHASVHTCLIIKPSILLKTETLVLINMLLLTLFTNAVWRLVYCNKTKVLVWFEILKNEYFFYKREPWGLLEIFPVKPLSWVENMNSITMRFYDHMLRQHDFMPKVSNMNGSNYDVVSTFNIGFNSFSVKITLLWRFWC